MIQNLFTPFGQSIWILFLLFEVQVFRQEVSANSVSSSLTVTQKLEDYKPLCRADLSKEIEAIIKRPEFARSRWGILVQTLNSEQNLYALNTDDYFIPASNVKLFTTAAILYQLGSQFRIRTSVYGVGSIPNLTTLRVIGRGDPSLTTTQLKSLAQQLKRQGVRQVSQLIVEDSYFKNTEINSTWEWGDVFFSYGVNASSLILNQNAVTLTVSPQKLGQPLALQWSDPVAGKQWQIENQTLTALEGKPEGIEIHGVLGKPILLIKGQLAIDAEPENWELAVVEPANYFLESFRQSLLDEGITVNQGLVNYHYLNHYLGRELAYIDSEPLANLIQEANQESNNLFAETLLKVLGSEATDKTDLEALRQSLTKLGVNPESYQLVDGSGLSRHNLVSPEALVQTLKIMAKIPEAKIYRDSLSVAGINGTLKQRFQNTSIQGNLYAKTGTLSGASSLSGYLNFPTYQPLVFSIIVNQSIQSPSVLRQAIDEIVVLLGNLKPC